MDTDGPTHHGSHSSSSTSAPSASQRKERGAIAAQACDTCRSRKQKCDEHRPKCGTCQKFKLECHYREPVPTKKDKTLVEILDRIKSLEGKVDSLSLRSSGGSYTGAVFGSTTQTPLVMDPSSMLSSEAITPLPLTASLRHSDSTSSAAAAAPYRYVAGVHQMFAWPVVQHLLETLGPKLASMSIGTIEQDAPSIVLGIDDAKSRLPSTPAGPLLVTDYHAARLSIPAPGAAGSLPLPTSALTWEAMQRLCKAYFDTFNFLFPVLDRQLFISGVMASILNDGLGDGITSTLAFLVFALGEVAIAGIQGVPITMRSNRPSGIKGGTLSQPPGIALFNEARKRMGFSLTECSLENVQVFALAGMYCGACAHHLEFWRMSTTASWACQALITSKPAELSSPRVDLIRRAFWYCSMIETTFNLELGLPLTGLDKFEDVVGLPNFNGPYSQDDYLANQASHFQEHFASQIALRRLSSEFHRALTAADLTQLALGSMATPFSSMSSMSSNDGPAAGLPAAIAQMAVQLDQWKAMLPAHLRWQEAQPAEFPNPMEAVYNQPMFPPTALPVPSVNSPSGYMFTTDLDSIPLVYPYALDVQVALLRTRYYYSKYLIHRPFVHKALHHPEQMTREDAEGASECLKACLKWPITMSPTCTHKRLVPYLFFWTQNILGILVLLHLSQQVPILLRIRTTLCGERFELEASETVGLYMDWVRDLKSIDRAAAWAWELIRGIYRVEE